MSPIHVLTAAILLSVSTTVLAASPQKQATPANDQIELAIADIALRTGFARQSHFTTTFRRLAWTNA